MSFLRHYHHSVHVILPNLKWLCTVALWHNLLALWHLLPKHDHFRIIDDDDDDDKGDDDDDDDDDD